MIKSLPRFNRSTQDVLESFSCRDDMNHQILHKFVKSMPAWVHDIITAKQWTSKHEIYESAMILSLQLFCWWYNSQLFFWIRNDFCFPVNTVRNVMVAFLFWLFQYYYTKYFSTYNCEILLNDSDVVLRVCLRWGIQQRPSVQTPFLELRRSRPRTLGVVVSDGVI